MSKKNRQIQTKHEESLGDNWTNPFKDLDIKIDNPPPQPPPPPKPSLQEQHADLSKEDLELLKAFGGDVPEAPSLKRADNIKKWPLLTLSCERKGRGGKTVTCIHGLSALGTLEQMDLCDRIKSSLGIGGRFVDGVLELQGDQRERASKWLEGNQFRTNYRSGK